MTTVKKRDSYRPVEERTNFRKRGFRVRKTEVAATVVVSALAASLAATVFLTVTGEEDHVVVESSDCEQHTEEWGMAADRERELRSAGGDAEAAKTLAMIEHSEYVLACFATDDALVGSLRARVEH